MILSKKIKQTIVYAGPSLPNGLLKQNTVFLNGELPPHVKDFANDADFAYFLINTSKLGEMIVKLKNKSSFESIKFQAVSNKFKGAK